MTNYPTSLINTIKTSKTPVFAQDITPDGASDCPNCGGIGFVYIFVTTSGPFRDPPGVRGDDVLKSLSDTMYGWVWYTGRMVGGECPDCHGLGRMNKPPKPMVANTEQAVKSLVGKLSNPMTAPVYDPAEEMITE